MTTKNLPLIYSCSGCSSVAQLANDSALELNERKVAQMSCISGVGGHVKPLVKLAQSGRPIIALDGCDLKCALHCLESVGAEPDLHYVLTDKGFKKRSYIGTSKENIDSLCQLVINDLKNTVSMSEAN